MHDTVHAAWPTGAEHIELIAHTSNVVAAAGKLRRDFLRVELAACSFLPSRK